MKLSDIFLMNDKPNINGRRYLPEELDNITEQINNRSSHIIGEFNPQYDTPMSVDMATASHVIESAERRGDGVYVNIKILNTTHGNALKDKINSDGMESVSFVPRGYGRILNRVDEFDEVADYKLIAVDSFSMNNFGGHWQTDGDQSEDE